MIQFNIVINLRTRLERDLGSTEGRQTRQIWQMRQKIEKCDHFFPLEFCQVTSLQDIKKISLASKDR